MPQSILIQVGQCGNQIGFQFWNNMMKEYSDYKDKLNDTHISYFLKAKEDMSNEKPLDECYNARGICIDMEPGVIHDQWRDQMKNMFQENQIFTDVSGSGNNWARGNLKFGQQHKVKIENIIRRQVEQTENLNSFFFIFSMGGGTGSGTGTAVLEFVKDMFPKVSRLVFPVYPRTDIDDVVTSPYNAILANNKLTEFADLIIPFDNQALINICTKIDKNKNKFLRAKPTLEAQSKRTKTSGASSRASLPFNDMNQLVVSVISDITSCSRLPGTLNIDINELVVNLSPYPKLKYAVPSSSPFILVPEDSKLERVFSDLFLPTNALAMCDTSKGVQVSTAVLARGKISVQDLQNNLNKSISKLNFVGYNNSSIKVGLCDFAPPGRNVSLLKVANTCQMAENLTLLKESFQKMYSKKAHLHHYQEQNMDDSDFSEVLSNLTDVIKEYCELKNSTEVCMETPRLNLV